jgi:hypothetical protein
MTLVFSPRISQKLLEKHGVTEADVRQCFENCQGEFLADKREGHATDPPSHWFISETNKRRKLKVIFVAREVETEKGKTLQVHIKSAFPPDEIETGIYERHGKC